ncbi:MAG: IS4 family transposase [Candidatus Magnetoovum sp. WYHC-5]|nr:IS4 family transposase [Candidatus Magnetoovum sp. WYHC-5]
MSRSGTHQRFSIEASNFFKKCLEVIISKMIENTKQIDTEILKPFPNVKIVDSSSWDVSPELKEIFGGFGGDASDANCKVQFMYEYKSASILMVEETRGNMPDQRYSKNIASLINKDELLLTDLGYWQFDTFYEVVQRGGYFLSRLNTQVNIWHKTEGDYKKLKIENLIYNQMSNSIEVEVFLRKNDTDQDIAVRIVGFRMSEEVANKRRMKLRKEAKKKGRVPTDRSMKLCDWSFFVTNAPEHLIPSEKIHIVYRIRWSIELVFKSWKSVLRVHLSNIRRNHNRLRCELYAKLILATIVHMIYNRLKFYAWHKKRKEISLYILWQFIISRAESLHKTIRVSVDRFLRKINRLLPLMIKTCEKNHQVSRKTTLQLIDEPSNTPKPKKLTLKDLEVLEVSCLT